MSNNSSAAQNLYKRLSRLKPQKGDEPIVQMRMTRAEISLIMPALKERYGL